jgi:hypothetical protein
MNSNTQKKKKKSEGEKPISQQKQQQNGIDTLIENLSNFEIFGFLCCANIEVQRN